MANEVSLLRQKGRKSNEDEKYHVKWVPKVLYLFAKIWHSIAPKYAGE